MHWSNDQSRDLLTVEPGARDTADGRRFATAISLCALHNDTKSIAESRRYWHPIFFKFLARPAFYADGGENPAGT